VATELHFGRAAQKLHMGQSTLSDLIQRLEREMGAPLLMRTTRRVALSSAGAELLGRAEAILDEVACAAAAVHRMAEGDTGTVRVGITPPVATVLSRRVHLLPPIQRVVSQPRHEHLPPAQQPYGQALQLLSPSRRGLRWWPIDTGPTQSARIDLSRQYLRLPRRIEPHDFAPVLARASGYESHLPVEHVPITTSFLLELGLCGSWIPRRYLTGSPRSSYSHRCPA
jgi:hypothetical protein